MCSKYIWMTKGGGVECRECGIRAHYDCQAFFPHNCSKTKKQKSSFSLGLGSISVKK